MLELLPWIKENGILAVLAAFVMVGVWKVFKFLAPYATRFMEAQITLVTSLQETTQTLASSSEQHTTLMAAMIESIGDHDKNVHRKIDEIIAIVSGKTPQQVAAERKSDSDSHRPHKAKA